MGLRIGGMSVQLLGNKWEEDNSGRQKSGLGRERGREREGKTAGEIEEGERERERVRQKDRQRNRAAG